MVQWLLRQESSKPSGQKAGGMFGNKGQGSGEGLGQGGANGSGKGAKGIGGGQGQGLRDGSCGQ